MIIHHSPPEAMFIFKMDPTITHDTNEADDILQKGLQKWIINVMTQGMSLGFFFWILYIHN